MTHAPKMLTGAASIAKYLGCTRRQIYHWSDTANLPLFRIGKTLCANPEKLLAWVKQHEQASEKGGL